jgi:CMP-N-acetylneuraminic acid synthetase
MYMIDEGDQTQGRLLRPLFTELAGLQEPFNHARQLLPKTYLHNGYIDIVNTDVVLKGFMSGMKIIPYVMSKEDTVDIDSEEDWLRAEEEAECLDL